MGRWEMRPLQSLHADLYGGKKIIKRAWMRARAPNLPTNRAQNRRMTSSPWYLCRKATLSLISDSLAAIFLRTAVAVAVAIAIAARDHGRLRCQSALLITGCRRFDRRRDRTDWRARHATPDAAFFHYSVEKEARKFDIFPTSNRVPS